MLELVLRAPLLHQKSFEEQLATWAQTATLSDWSAQAPSRQQWRDTLLLVVVVVVVVVASLEIERRLADELAIDNFGLVLRPSGVVLLQQCRVESSRFE